MKLLSWIRFGSNKWPIKVRVWWWIHQLKPDQTWSSKAWVPSTSCFTRTTGPNVICCPSGATRCHKMCLILAAEGHFGEQPHFASRPENDWRWQTCSWGLSQDWRYYMWRVVTSLRIERETDLMRMENKLVVISRDRPTPAWPNQDVDRG